jgi:DIS3-like exonuclease 2
LTIDPITAKDLDDALSIEHIHETIYEIGVHIADVSYFVQQGSDLDKEALKRGTSTYFVHRVYPMLPKLLCERLCSLNPRVDRLAYSIFFRMDMGSGEVDKSYEPRVERSVIRSCAKWNYELAQKIIMGELTSEDELSDDFKPAGHSFLDVAQDILALHTIAQARRKQRLEAGSLVFNNADFNFTLNPETSFPIRYSESPRMESKQLVEEFMLMANILVAECLYDYCKDKALLRAHADIKENRKAELETFFKAVGLDG